MYSTMYQNFSMIALFDNKAKEPFIVESRKRGFVPFCYSINKELIKVMDNNSPYDEPVVGVMILIEYKKNEIQC